MSARVLVVDDEVELMTVLCELLAEHGYETIGCASAEQALVVLHEREIDLLVTDLMMPGMTGRELAVVVRRKFPNVRVLYVTGFADTLFQGVNELGDGESFIEKPFGTDGLLEATRLLMFGHISDEQAPQDKHDDETEWQDERVRTKIVRVLRKLNMA